MDTPKKLYLARWNELVTRRQPVFDHWRELADYIQPRRGRFLTSDKNQLGKKNDKIINGTARRASRVLASGMMAGITSPARPWFRLTTPDPSLADHGSVKNWLHLCEERMRQAFARSNLYNCLHNVYEDLGTPGTTAMLVEEDAEDIIRGYNHPVGQYVLASSEVGRIDTLYRERLFTVKQLVDRFTLEKCSPNVQRQYRERKLDQDVEVLHAVEPRLDYQEGKDGPAGMRWKSCWLEKNASDNQELLLESGYHEFPNMCPRWSVNGEDDYGSSPAMDALGDVKALQVLEKRKGQAVDKIVNPPMRAPTSLINGQLSINPGEVTYVDTVHTGQKFEPAVEVQYGAITAVAAEIREHERRINEAFYADLWLMLAMDKGGKMTAREVAERHEEKFLQLGPVLERLQDELLDPLIDRVFAILLRAGQIPPPPEELLGVELRVEYISVLAQAQKIVGTTAVDRLAGFALSLAQARPDVLDKLNVDAMMDAYGDMLGTKPDLLNPADKVAEIRAARAQQQQAAQQLAAEQAAAEGAKTLSQADTEGDNALTRLLSSAGVDPGSVPGAAR